MASIIIDKIVPTKWRIRLRDADGKTREVEYRTGTPLQLDTIKAAADKRSDAVATKARPAKAEKPRSEKPERSKRADTNKPTAEATRAERSKSEDTDDKPAAKAPVRRRRTRARHRAPARSCGRRRRTTASRASAPRTKSAAPEILHAGGDAFALYEWNSGKYQTLTCGTIEALKQEAAQWTENGKLHAPRSNLGAEAAKVACAVPEAPTPPATPPPHRHPAPPAVDPEKDKVLMQRITVHRTKLPRRQEGLPMTREERVLEQLIGDLLDNPPPGVAPSEMESWLRSRATNLIATVRKGLRQRLRPLLRGIEGTWYVDDQFLRNLAAHHERPVRARRLGGPAVPRLPALPLAAWPPRPPRPGRMNLRLRAQRRAKIPAQLHRWAQEQGLARFEGQWPQWPARSSPDPTACASCQARAAASKGCGCTACKSARWRTTHERHRLLRGSGPRLARLPPPTIDHAYFDAFVTRNRDRSRPPSPRCSTSSTLHAATAHPEDCRRVSTPVRNRRRSSGEFAKSIAV